MVLSTQCTGAVNEVKLVSGKAVLKGEIRAEVVYRTAPATHWHTPSRGRYLSMRYWM